MSTLFTRIVSHFRRPAAGRSRGQSYLELALVLPVLLIMLLGLVEVAYFIARYLDLLDLTREAARFASIRDPFDNPNPDQDCSTPDLFEFYYDTACVFSPPNGSAFCTNKTKNGPSPLGLHDPFCNGLNPYVNFDRTVDDVVISVYTVSGNRVTNVWPSAGYWALSDHDNDTAHNSNWKNDCQGSQVRTAPHFNESAINAMLQSGAPPNKGFVAVELYYCYNQLLNLPLIDTFIPNPLRVHVYTIMPIPAAQPTATTTP